MCFGIFLTHNKFSLITEDDIALNIISIYLNGDNSIECFNVSINQEGLVEGTESLELAVELNTDANNFGIRSVHPNTTLITITDHDCKLLHFHQKEFNFSTFA